MSTFPSLPGDDSTRPVVEIVADEETYLERLHVLVRQGSPEQALPVIAGPCLSRYQTWRHGATGHRGADAFARDSVVAALSRSRWSIVGEALALMSERRFVAAPDPPAAIAAGGDVPLTLVAAPEEVTPEMLAELPPVKPISVLTARDTGAVSALVYRLLDLPAHRYSELVVEWSPVESGRSDDRRLVGRAATRGALTRRLDGRPVLLTLATHGRSCCLFLQDGVVCGRAPDDMGGRGKLSCQQGAGCFRLGWTGERLVKARDLGVPIVYVNACSALEVSDGQIAPEGSLALSALDGVAVAFVSSLWPRFGGGEAAAQLLRGALKTGSTLGAAVVLANECIEADPSSTGTFLLVGDAGLRPIEPLDHQSGLDMTSADDGTDARVGGTKAGVFSSGRGWTAPRPLPDPLPTGAQRSQTARSMPKGSTLMSGDVLRIIGGAVEALGMVEQLGGPAIGRPLDELRRGVLALGRLVWERGREPGFAEELERHRAVIASQLDAVQADIVRSLLEQITTSWYHFVSGWPRPLEVIAGGTVVCAVCSSSIARRQVMTWRGSERLRLWMDVCPRCAELYEGLAEPAFTWRFGAPDLVRRGEQFVQRLTLHNQTDRELRCAVGAAIRFETFHEAALSQCTSLVIPPAGEAEAVFSGMFPADGPSSDLHFLKFPVIANGELCVLSRPVWLLR